MLFSQKTHTEKHFLALAKQEDTFLTQRKKYLMFCFASYFHLALTTLTGQAWLLLRRVKLRALAGSEESITRNK